MFYIIYEFSAVGIRKMDTWPPALQTIHKHHEVFKAMTKYIASTGRLNSPKGRTPTVTVRRENITQPILW